MPSKKQQESVKSAFSKQFIFKTRLEILNVINLFLKSLKKKNKLTNQKRRRTMPVSFAITILLLLSFLNLYMYSRPSKKTVLGISTENNEGVFWYELLKKHPDYVPGWIAIGRTDKASEIDPNYLSEIQKY